MFETLRRISRMSVDNFISCLRRMALTLSGSGDNIGKSEASVGPQTESLLSKPTPQSFASWRESERKGRSWNIGFPESSAMARFPCKYWIDWCFS